jgi:hypothetical protein
MSYGEDSCVECQQFFGHTEGKCSACYRRPFMTPEEIVLDSRVQWAKTPMPDEDLDKWISTGIRETKDNGHCAICLQDGLSLISNYACNCAPITCATCNTLADRCPTCRCGKYRRVTKEEIKDLLANKCSKASKKKMAISAIREGYTSPFCLDQLICHASEIDEILQEDPYGGDCQLYNTIYCLAPDYFRMTFEPARYVMCYKGYFGSGTDYVLSYPELIAHRKQMDIFDLMTIVFTW